MLDVGVVAFDLEEIRAEAAEVEHGFKADSAFEGAITAGFVDEAETTETGVDDSLTGAATFEEEVEVEVTTDTTGAAVVGVAEEVLVRVVDRLCSWNSYFGSSRFGSFMEPSLG